MGTALVKHFELQTAPGKFRRLETRVLFHHSNGWFGYTYRWNDIQTDADLVREAHIQDIPIDFSEVGEPRKTQTWYYPSSFDCHRCHTQVSGRVLGLQTLQMNHSFNYSGFRENQLDAMNRIGLFTSDIGSSGEYETYPSLQDNKASLSSRARAYLAANCSHCHRSSGPTPVSIDLQFGIPLNSTKIVGQLPQSGNLGVNNLIVAPARKESSTLWLRMNTTSHFRMPPLATNELDKQAIEVIGDWIDSMVQANSNPGD